MTDEFKTLQKFDAGNGREAFFHSLPALEDKASGRSRACRSASASCSNRCCAIATARRFGARMSRRSPTGRRSSRRTRRSRSSSRASCCRTSPACRCWSISRRCAARWNAWAAIRRSSSRSCRSIWWSITRCRSTSPARADALQLNMEMEFKRNRERYQFLKWGMQAFETFSVVPPGIGIVHQVNLEYLAKGVLRRRTESESSIYPDTLVGTDSHTTMINGLGVVGWGVGGIEAEAGMLGQPVYFLTPEVVGVHLTGALREGVTATDLVLHVTQMLRKAEGGRQVRRVLRRRRGVAAACRTARRSPTWRPSTARRWASSRSTRSLSNYLRATGRTEEQCAGFRELLQGAGHVRHSAEGRDRLQRRARARPRRRCSRASPDRSARRIGSSCRSWARLSARSLRKPVSEGGYGKDRRRLGERVSRST